MSDAGNIPGTSDWCSLCKARKAVQDASIPKEWKIKVPPDTSLDVRTVTEDCGLLSSRELDIIDIGTKDVSALVRLLADESSGYTSLEVTTAYLKSAIIAHQVVSLRSMDLASRVYQTIDADKLSHGNLR
jgi:amidase